MPAPSAGIPPVQAIAPEGDAIIVLLPHAPTEETTSAHPDLKYADARVRCLAQPTPVDLTWKARFRVCAKHLTLASSYFKSSLGWRW